jgi:Na+/H+ antiporter NhaD/arsenite permease-like protein
MLKLAGAALLFVFFPQAAFAAGDIGGASMGIAWSLPFAGMLLSIALGPVLFPHFWELNYGKFAAFWAALVIVPLLLFRGADPALGALFHTALLDYIPFIILLFALFTIAGGILITGNLHGTPATNTVLLAIGTLMASFVGTTGASIIMIRPVLRANDDRRFNVHVVVFFIFLVSNIGGSLTPLGDPPLFSHCSTRSTAGSSARRRTTRRCAIRRPIAPSSCSARSISSCSAASSSPS